MSSQGQHHVSDASFRNSQTRSGILTPDSEQLSDGAGFGRRKRKRDGNSMEDLLRDKFIVKPYPSTIPTRPQCLQPLMLLPRANLPLSALDPFSSNKGLAQSRLFESHVKILELEERMGSQPTVLIARLDDTRTLYAVEREGHGLYVLYQLGSWVSLNELRAAAVVARQEVPDVAGVSKTPVQQSMPESSKFSKKKRLAIEAIQSMIKRPSTGLLPDSQLESQIVEEPSFGLDTILPVEESAFEPHMNDTPLPLDVVPSQPTASEIFENVRTQYLETLYLSKASLAYFAKGPLSRARAAFHLDYDAALDLNDHIAFLESLVMSTNVVDKKYRDGVPNCISLIDVHDHSAEDVAMKPKKRKAVKKMKVGKNGLYPTEDPLIRRWWTNHDEEAETGAPGTSREELAKARISELRIRETQLQLIIILEVLALQPLASATEDVGSGLPSALPMVEQPNNDKPVKSKKPDHLTMLTDVHIDRLCIWQSIALESINAPSGDSQHADKKADTALTQTKHTDSFLRDFCVEVIAPFFQSRLPDRCAIINRKLGGPVAVSPPKPKLAKSSSFSGALSRPGAATKRPVPIKPRRSLQRVLTDDRERRSMSRGPNRKIALMRSATMPLIPGLKREGSEAPSLSGIPTADSHETSRGGMINSKHFSRREVDLSALRPTNNAKENKQAIIDAELREAISALKKPNREMAGKALADTAEKRAVPTSSRKSKKPIRNPLFQTMQQQIEISATPKANRQKDMFFVPQQSSLERMVSEAMIPASSVPRVPASVARGSSGASQRRNPLLSSVQATPTRKAVPGFSQRSSMAAFEHGFPPSSPLHVRRSSAQLFTAVPESATRNPFAALPGLEETPVKKRPESASEHSHPTIPSMGNDKENEKLGATVGTVQPRQITQGATKDDSIYKSLGWDDDDIDDLA